MAMMTALTALSTMVSVAGGIAQGNAEQEAANAEALRQEANAKQAVAKATHKAEEDRRKGTVQASNQNAIMGASGSSKGISGRGYLSETKSLSELDALITQAEGEQRGKVLEDQAALSRFKGKQAKSAATFGAVGTLIGGFGRVAKTGGFGRIG